MTLYFIVYRDHQWYTRRFNEVIHIIRKSSNMKGVGYRLVPNCFRAWHFLVEKRLVPSKKWLCGVWGRLTGNVERGIARVGRSRDQESRVVYVNVGLRVRVRVRVIVGPRVRAIVGHRIRVTVGLRVRSRVGKKRCQYVFGLCLRNKKQG